MASVTVCLLIFLLSRVVPLSAKEHQGQSCPSSFRCGSLGVLSYPFTTIFQPSCGLCAINCSEPTPTIRLGSQGGWYDINISFSNNKSFLLSDDKLLHAVDEDNCHAFNETSPLPRSRSLSSITLYNQTTSKCPKDFTVPNVRMDDNFRRILQCGGFDIYHSNNSQVVLSDCSPFLYPTFLVVEVSNECSECNSEGGLCQDLDNGKQFRCVNKKKGRWKLSLLLVLGVLEGGMGLMILGLFLWHCKVKFGLPTTSSRNISSDTTRTDLGRSKMYFSVPVFTYNELEEATKSFDPSMELGDGGFGTVYYGKLKDGREVAIKRLYQRSYRQQEQFMNEIEILTCLRHQNLVSLYGCTSRRSQELLLVYEYVPNGTVADHLYGEQAKCGMLTWPLRMSIAIETARALTYLHASDIIHRDVKSNNILLDNNFGVKVADFGLSRLFPMDVTHISTVPQGTPGYLDPEYNLCYQLTDKSDVYSFGVVLVELISSMPAVDVSRREDDINLSFYAMKKIQCCAFGELVDKRLGFESSDRVRRMSVAVAELAFQCLQHKKEFRPSMAEVLEALQGIENANCEAMSVQKKEENDRVWLLRNTENPSSPKSVMQKWASSRYTTPATSV